MMLVVEGPARVFALGLTAIGALAVPMAVLLAVALETSALATANEA
jgi:hypothetical protein